MITEMRKGQEVLHFYYDAASKLASVKYNDKIYTYVQNLQGDVVGILDSAGSLVVEYKYDAWGRLLSTTGILASTLGMSNPFRYRGYVYDEEIGLYYLRSRYYNPNNGRFINGDAIVMTDYSISAMNIYMYCQNCPVHLHDADGFFNLPIVQDIPKPVVYVRNPNPNDPHSLPRIYHYKDVNEKTYDNVRKSVNIASIFIPWGKVLKVAKGLTKGIKGIKAVANSKAVKAVAKAVATHPKTAKTATKIVAASQEWWDISLGSIVADIFVGEDGWVSEAWDPYSPYLNEDEYCVIYECEVPNIEPTPSRGEIPPIDSFS